jgi:integrase/recombinase XerD
MRADTGISAATAATTSCPELEAFMDHLRLERGLSLNTCTSYRKDIENFLAFLSRTGVTLSGASIAEGQRYGAELRRKGLKDSSIARHISALRSFYNFLMGSAVLQNNPMALLQTPHIRRPLPHVLTATDVVRLLEAPDTSDTLGIRDRAMWELMYSSALRVSEVTGLKFGDLDLEDGWALIRGKGSKERWVPVGESARDWVKKYLREARPQLIRTAKNVQWIFLNSRGKPLTRQGVWQLLKSYAARLSPPLNLHPHTLRHCCATHLLEGGADLRTVQEFLGHADISTTQIYTQVDRNYLREVHRSFHPRG